MKKGHKKSKKEGKKGVGHSIEHETESNVLEIVRLENEQRDKRSIGAKLSEQIALFCGSMPFVYAHLAWFSAWILVNTLTRFKFDPAPFTYLWLIVSLEAFLISIFILISQNHEAEMTERRNHLDLQINMLVERENTKILEMLQAIAERVGVEADDKELKALMQPIEPERLVEQIISASEKESQATADTQSTE